jgi:hypothetical protein
MSADTVRDRRLGPAVDDDRVKARDGTDQTDVRPNASAVVEAALSKARLPPLVRVLLVADVGCRRPESSTRTFARPPESAVNCQAQWTWKPAQH